MSTAFTALAVEGGSALIDRDQRWLRQGKIDAATLVTLLVFVVPALVVLVLSRNWEGGWVWPVRVFTVLWAVVWGGVGLSQLRKPLAEPEETAIAG